MASWKAIRSHRPTKDPDIQASIELDFRKEWLHRNILGTDDVTIRWHFLPPPYFLPLSNDWWLLPPSPHGVPHQATWEDYHHLLKYRLLKDHYHLPNVLLEWCLLNWHLIVVPYLLEVNEKLLLSKSKKNHKWISIKGINHYWNKRDSSYLNTSG
jgi:hypothetical protein